MALTAEDGTGVVGAESYATEAGADTYFGKRTHTALYTTWNAGTTATKEGALREATEYLDARWGQFYRGVKRGTVQGLQWPRSDALDDAGYPLPDLPPELVNACYELAARALSARLAEDRDRGGKVKRERVEGAVEVEYMDSAPSSTTYGSVAGILAPILNGAQPEARAPSWNWR